MVEGKYIEPRACERCTMLLSRGCIKGVRVLEVIGKASKVWTWNCWEFEALGFSDLGLGFSIPQGPST